MKKKQKTIKVWGIAYDGKLDFEGGFKKTKSQLINEIVLSGYNPQNFKIVKVILTYNL